MALDPSPPIPETQKVSPVNFEAAIDRLEAIVQQMEGARLPLEGLLACYEEGTRLVKSCGEFLVTAEQRIELITQDAEGRPRTSGFDPGDTSPDGASAPRGRAKPAGRADSSPATKEPKNPASPNHEVSLF